MTEEELQMLERSGGVTTCKLVKEYRRLTSGRKVWATQSDADHQDVFAVSRTVDRGGRAVRPLSGEQLYCLVPVEEKP